MNRESQGRWNWWGETDLETKEASREYINFLDYMRINLDQVPHNPKNILLDKEYLQLFLLLKISDWESYLEEFCPTKPTIYRKLRQLRPDYKEYKKEWWKTVYKRSCNGRWFYWAIDKERDAIIESIREDLLKELLQNIKRRTPMTEMNIFLKDDWGVYKGNGRYLDRLQQDKLWQTKWLTGYDEDGGDFSGYDFSGYDEDED